MGHWKGKAVKMKKGCIKAYLEDLIVLIRCLYPLSSVRLSYKWEQEIVRYNWKEEHKELYISLIKSMTLLNKQHRRQDDKSRYYSTRDDVQQA